jgi:hypothetical protein
VLFLPLKIRNKVRLIMKGVREGSVSLLPSHERRTFPVGFTHG